MRRWSQASLEKWNDQMEKDFECLAREFGLDPLSWNKVPLKGLWKCMT